LLAATLGNEIALSVPASYLSGTPLGRMPLKGRAATVEPLMLIAMRDREALAPKLRPLLETNGKPASSSDKPFDSKREY